MRSSTLLLLAAAFSGVFTPAQAPADLITRTSLMSGAVGFWSFSEGTGTTAADSSTTTPAISLNFGGSASPAWQTAGGPMGGMFGSYLLFQGNSYLTGGSVGLLDFSPNQAFSVACWVQLGADYANDWLVSKMHAAGGDFPHRGWGLMGRGSGIATGQNRVDFWLRDSTSNAILVSSASGTLPENEWVHLAVTYDGSGAGSGVAMYVNGASVATYGAAALSGDAVTTNDAPFNISGRNNGSGARSDYLDEVGVWSRVLTASEVASLVPEPSAAMLLAVALLALLGRRRRT